MCKTTKTEYRGSSSRKLALTKIAKPLTVILALAFALMLGAEAMSGQTAALSLKQDVHALSDTRFALSSYGTAAVVLRSGVVAPSIAPVLGLAMADFTGDTNPDMATVELDRFDSASVHYSIEIQLTEGGRQFLKLTAPFGGLHITPRDVTGDGNLDLVVRAASTGALLAVYLNDGSGHFSPAEPAAFAKSLPQGSSNFGFTTGQQPYFGATFVCSESYTIECRNGSLRTLQEKNRWFFIASHISPLSAALSSGSNRAPPTFTTYI
jgi:hypothetical protein